MMSKGQVVVTCATGLFLFFWRTGTKRRCKRRRPWPGGWDSWRCARASAWGFRSAPRVLLPPCWRWAAGRPSMGQFHAPSTRTTLPSTLSRRAPVPSVDALTFSLLLVLFSLMSVRCACRPQILPVSVRLTVPVRRWLPVRRVPRRRLRGWLLWRGVPICGRRVWRVPVWRRI